MLALSILLGECVLDKPPRPLSNPIASIVLPTMSPLIVVPDPDSFVSNRNGSQNIRFSKGKHCTIACDLDTFARVCGRTPLMVILFDAVAADPVHVAHASIDISSLIQGLKDNPASPARLTIDSRLASQQELNCGTLQVQLEVCSLDSSERREKFDPIAWPPVQSPPNHCTLASIPCQIIR
jgi:hypothetical protein